jgi:hypothetical protein
MAALALLCATLVVGYLGMRWVFGHQEDRFVARVIVIGLAAKLAGSMVRYTIIGDLYGDEAGDFNRYFENGTRLASMIRSGAMPEEASSTGTPFMDFISGVVYAVLPSNIVLGFLFFALLAFIGALLMLRAFQLAVPEGNHRRFALCVFLLPTMLFWPSSIGKEAWLVFTLGLAAYGAARVLKRQRFGYLILALGAAGAFQVRPHMGALFAVCFAAAFLLRFRDPDVKKGAVGWAVGLVVVALGAGFLASSFGDELPRDESIEGSATDQIFAETDRRTSQGGSAYESQPVRSPADLVKALITVPFRPFPTEAHNRQAQYTSLEGVFLLLLVLVSFSRLATLPRMVLRRPFVALAAAYTFGFVIAFSNVGNFGILTRQRAQLLPFLLVLLCLPRREELKTISGATRSSAEPAAPAPILLDVPPPDGSIGGQTIP